jgi:hypothetical protein
MDEPVEKVSEGTRWGEAEESDLTECATIVILTISSVYIPAPVKHSLARQWEQMNPSVLRKEMEAKLKKIFRCCYNRVKDESPTL